MTIHINIDLKASLSDSVLRIKRSTKSQQLCPAMLDQRKFTGCATQLSLWCRSMTLTSRPAWAAGHQRHWGRNVAITLVRRWWVVSTNSHCRARVRYTCNNTIYEEVESQMKAEINYYPGCYSQAQEWFPTDMPAPLQYGSSIRAYCLISSYALIMARQGFNTLDRICYQTNGQALKRE